MEGVGAPGSAVESSAGVRRSGPRRRSDPPAPRCSSAWRTPRPPLQPGLGGAGSNGVG